MSTSTIEPSSSATGPAPGARPRRSAPPFSVRLRYAFDNSMAAGPAAMIALLGLASLAVVLVAGIVVLLFGISVGDAGRVGFIEGSWQALMRTLDSGTMGGDTGWPFRIVMLAVTIGGIFVVGGLIGVITTGLESRMEELRKGRSPVLEEGHTLVLGWSQKVFTLLAELAVANDNVKRPRVVVLADRDKVEMEDEIRANLDGRLGRTKVVCRSGNPLSHVDLAIANPAGAKSVVVLAPEEDSRADAYVLKALLALCNGPHRPAGANHIVATLQDEKTMEVARLVGKDDVRLVNVGDLIARVTAQTCRQSGLSVVYRELLDFDGDEIYFQMEPGLVGRTYGDALLAYEDAAVIGLRRASREVFVNPAMDTVIESGDHVIAIAADDDKVVLPAQPVAAPEVGKIVEAAPEVGAPERTLVLGWNSRAPQIIRQLDEYVASGSSVDVLVERDEAGEAAVALRSALRNLTVGAWDGDSTDREVLESVDPGSYDHIILLADDGAADPDEADTRTLVSLLHLRDLATTRGYDYSIVTEVLDSRNRELARSTSADDFIVSDELLSLLLAQISEEAALADVLTGLFDSDGSEIYLRPAADYVAEGSHTSFSTVVDAARRRGETAIGYRSAADSGSADGTHGIRVNPPKSSTREWAAADKVIVLAED